MFDKEHVHNEVNIDNFGQSWTPICPPTLKNQGLWPGFYFIGLGLTHTCTPTYTKFLSYYSSGEKHSINEKENAVLMQSELRFYGKTGQYWMQKVYVPLYVSLLVNCLLVCSNDSGHSNTNMACVVQM